ncbi:MAG: (deoxy)nucleoside triphosphate pyrophosphohydrolase [Syntrophobacteraceae bacterium]|jgi:mutator protein MutT|nr:(deoxy)nucleoside triphosphate pyrophosphohydrolase [Syntrophobacteraceae bacterium]
MKSTHFNPPEPSAPPEFDQGSIRVTAALIIAEGRIFIAQRPLHKKYGGLWEFPGGKVESGETLQEALYREIIEELCWRVRVGELVHRVQDPGESEGVELYAFWCSIAEGDLCLREHIDHYWALPEELHQFPFTQPDREIISLLQKLRCFPD